MLELISIVITNIIYIVLSNYLVLDQRIEYYIDSYPYSYYVLIFLLAIMTLYIRFQTSLSIWTYLLIGGIITAFFAFTPFLKLNEQY